MNIKKYILIGLGIMIPSLRAISPKKLMNAIRNSWVFDEMHCSYLNMVTLILYHQLSNKNISKEQAHKLIESSLKELRKIDQALKNLQEEETKEENKVSTNTEKINAALHSIKTLFQTKNMQIYEEYRKKIEKEIEETKNTEKIAEVLINLDNEVDEFYNNKQNDRLLWQHVRIEILYHEPKNAPKYTYLRYVFMLNLDNELNINTDKSTRIRCPYPRYEILNIIESEYRPTFFNLTQTLLNQCRKKFIMCLSTLNTKYAELIELYNKIVLLCRSLNNVKPYKRMEPVRIGKFETCSALDYLLEPDEANKRQLRRFDNKLFIKHTNNPNNQLKEGD